MSVCTMICNAQIISVHLPTGKYAISQQSWCWAALRARLDERVARCRKGGKHQRIAVAHPVVLHCHISAARQLVLHAGEHVGMCLPPGGPDLLQPAEEGWLMPGKVQGPALDSCQPRCSVSQQATLIVTTESVCSSFWSDPQGLSWRGGGVLRRGRHGERVCGGGG